MARLNDYMDELNRAIKEADAKALDQIEDILAGLSEDSYVGMAFEGCVAMARDNLAEEAYTSPLDWKDDWANAERKRQYYYVRYTNLVDKAETLSLAHHEALAAMDRANARAAEAEKEAEALRERLDAAQRDADGRRLEVLELKAKLYDLMTA